MMYGYNITQPNDKLYPLSFDSLCKIIAGENKMIAEKINQLRRVKIIDSNAYRSLKIQLPYFTVGNFNPPFRRSENVTYADFLILDFDYLSQKKLSIDELKKKFASLDTVCLCFVSPGNDGLKLLFKLEPKIYDKNLFKVFYKTFAINICKQFNLEQIIDLRTCDITRATFMSVDYNYYANANATPVNFNDFINTENTIQFDEALKKIKEEQENIEVKTTKYTNDLTDEILQVIKQKLNPNYKPPQKHIYVPEKLNEVVPIIEKELNQNGLKLEKVENINYGKKLKITLGNRWAEINLFYGKKGFSLVKTPKNGSDGELCEIAFKFLQQLLSI